MAGGPKKKRCYTNSFIHPPKQNPKKDPVQYLILKVEKKTTSQDFVKVWSMTWWRKLVMHHPHMVWCLVYGPTTAGLTQEKIIKKTPRPLPEASIAQKNMGATR